MHLAVAFLDEEIQKFAANFRTSQHEDSLILASGRGTHSPRISRMFADQNKSA
jgi:hypothetical protein